MTRLPKNRDTQLTRTEIAAEMLRQFDRGEDPSIRSLAAALEVAPSAIYHHYDSREAIVDAVLELVWREAAEEGVKLLEGKGEDPLEFLLLAALATRRAFGRHHHVAPYIAATPEANEQLAANLGLLAAAFEALGLSGERAGDAFHAYGSYAIGSTLVLAARLNLDHQSATRGDRGAERPGGSTHRALEAMMNLSNADPQRDEELFLDGLRRLIGSFIES